MSLLCATSILFGLSFQGISAHLDEVSRWGPLPSRFFETPMTPAERMPLCGNGRVDTEEDYRAYYTNHSDEWVPVPFQNAYMNLRLIAPRERCDGTAAQ